MDAKALIAAYYDAFNAGRTDDMLALLHAVKPDAQLAQAAH